jgi:hypothetical protein
MPTEPKTLLPRYQYAQTLEEWLGGKPLPLPKYPRSQEDIDRAKKEEIRHFNQMLNQFLVDTAKYVASPLPRRRWWQLL